jgi:hypothetical protein
MVKISWYNGCVILSKPVRMPLQAVLILIALASDFGSMKEAWIHITGLKHMIDQHGGISQFIHDPFLERQLGELAISRKFHAILSCESDCAHPFRFSRQERDLIRL